MTRTLVIMAAGLGQRFGGPKQLAPVGPAGEALLDYALVDAARAGFGSAVIVVRAELHGAIADHLQRYAGSGFPIELVQQRLDDLPAWFLPPAGRTKPWGTAHAVLAARDAVGDGGFAVCNADDWYGPESFRIAAGHLAASGASTITEHALVAYRLDETLSSAGGVARGVVHASPGGWLESIAEVRELRASGSGVVGQLDGRDVHYEGRELVSMNLWAFRPGVLPNLASQFERFLARHLDDPAAEFPLSTAVGEQVSTGRARVRVLSTGERWAGMTYQSEVDEVRALIRDRIARGDYPADLAGAFR